MSVTTGRRGQAEKAKWDLIFYLSLRSYMSSNYPYGLDPNYGASYLPPGAVAPSAVVEDGKVKEDLGKGKEATSPVDSAKVKGFQCQAGNMC